MNARDALVIAVFVLMLAGALGLGAYVAMRPERPTEDGSDDLDGHFGGLWWMR